MTDVWHAIAGNMHCRSLKPGLQDRYIIEIRGNEEGQDMHIDVAWVATEFGRRPGGSPG
jgi:hypothetical protein